MKRSETNHRRDTDSNGDESFEMKRRETNSKETNGTDTHQNRIRFVSVPFVSLLFISDDSSESRLSQSPFNLA